MTNLSTARERVEAYCVEMNRPNSPYRTEDEIQASIWDKAGGLILCDDLRTLLAALPNPTAPSGLGGEGWRLVPVEPTAEQIKAIARAFGAETGELLAILMDVRESETLKVIVDSYHAALAASPQPPTAPSRERVGELIEAIRPFADLAKKFLDRPLPLDKRGVVLRVPLGAAQQGRTGADLDIYPDAALTIGHFRAAARALDRIEEPEGKG